MKLTSETIMLIAQLALKYTPEVAIAFARMFKGGATIDDAIAALEVAKTETAEQIRAEVRAELEAEKAAALVIAGNP